MPPKGWRKNAEGQYPQPAKDQDLVSIDDILFPRATVLKLAKSITADGSDSNMIMAKDSLVSVQRAATVFVSHLLFHARGASREADRKTINAQDILYALERAEFRGFVPEVKLRLMTYEHNVELKKKQKAEAKSLSTQLPLAKRLKDNNSVAQTAPLDEEDEVEEVDEDLDMAPVEQIEEPVEVEEVAEVQSNPIAALSKEETELQGNDTEEVVEEPEMVDDSDDEN